MKSPGKIKPIVVFNFQVDGGKFSGSRIRFGDTTGSGKPFQQAIINEYPDG